VQRPIPPPLFWAWQAITAFAGLFTLVSAFADPVDLWRITVHSHQGKPLKAVATLQALPEERITQECLSMGPESDAPGSDAPFLTNARLTLNARGDAVEISTDSPVSSPTLALVLRVQCPGAFFYARHFTLLIPPAPKAAQATPQRPPRGFTLRVGAGESVESLAVSISPKNRKLRRLLVDEVVRLNPQVFPDGKLKPVAAGTMLFFPEVRGLSERAGRPARRTPAVTPPDGEPAPEAATPVKRPVKRRATEARPGEPVRLRRALELGERPGPQECRALMPLCGVEQALGVEVPPALEEKARGIESGVQELRLKQESMDSQLARLEQSLAALQKIVEAPVRPAPPAPAPKPEIRTVVKTEPLPWYYWAGFAAIAVACAVGGFAFGRRQAYAGTLSETDDRLDKMLASAATAIRELDVEPAPPPQRVASQPQPPPRARPAPPPVTRTETIAQRETPETDIKRELGSQALAPGNNVDVELESGAAAQSVGLSSRILFEMDQALDNTRSMFTDVDRFIALGRTQNALSLLQFQVHRDPKDRDSWIKLMAIYRQEKMDSELAAAAREFMKNFPGEDASSV
jgi:Tfp pilus assembly protein FimV